MWGWLHAVPLLIPYWNPEDSDPVPQLDAWKGDEPGLSDSWSVVADPLYRGKIDRWQKECAAAGKRPAS